MKAKVVIGQRSLGEKMKKLSIEAKLSCVYINHSIRATMITKRDKSGYEAQHIMAVSGHRNESSIRSYSSNKLEREEENVTDIIQITEQ